MRLALAAAAALVLAMPGVASAAFGDLPSTGLVRLDLGPVFPIDGPHDLGRNPANRFGGGRGHKGQDMFADCGTPVIAAQTGTVRFADYEGAAGNYLVVHVSASGEDEVYMHLRDFPSQVHGDHVDAGQRIGRVGRSGDADGCHLHFELWSAPGWYRGGAPFDPLPRLRRWDALPTP